MPSFSVVAMVRETPDVLERFVGYYLALGADRVRLYFDGEADEAIVPHLPGVDLTVCDRAWWDHLLGHQPVSNGEAMRAVFREAHESGTSDWQFFCDADEFLVSDAPVGDVLARFPESCESIRIMNTEAAWGPGDEAGAPFGCSWFRLPLSQRKDRVLKLLMPARRWHLFGRGFVGHPDGKHFLRRGTQVDAHHPHYSLRNDRPIGDWAYARDLNFKSLFVAHFDAVSETRWSEKWRRRISNERPASRLGDKRNAQVAAIQAAAGEDRMEDVFRELYVIGRYEAMLLAAGRAVIRRRLFEDVAT